MKVLITGATRRQTHREHAGVVDYSPWIHMFHDAIVELGHKVTMAPVDPERRYDKYDRIFVGLAPLEAFNSTYRLEILWLLKHVGFDDQRLNVYVDDWDLANIKNSFRRVARLQMGWFEQKKDLFRFSEFMKKHARSVVPIAKEINDRPCCLGTVVTAMFPWGEHDLYLKWLEMCGGVWGLDPSSLVPFLGRTFPDKRRIWITSSLSKGRHTKFVERHAQLKWPIKSVGAGFEYVPQRTLDSMFSRTWGALLATYPHAGSGMYRNRYKKLASANSILCVGMKDATELDTCYERAADPEEVEMMSDGELKSLADDQQRWFFAHSWTKEKLMSELDKLVRRRV